MAIYHLEAKVISRGNGRSACAAAAYMSCSKIYNDYDGILHDYTHKQGLAWQQVFLPENAPSEWQDREVLWNAVEENEKTKDSRLAREFVAALPVELNKVQWQALLTEFVQEQFVADGMCADVCIHDTDGHNPHAHIMLTVRPLDEQGKWQYKTQKEYLCVRGGEERGFTAAEFKTAQADGWEKQYPYIPEKGKKKIYLPPSEADRRGLIRVDKHPKSTKYGRQNPIAAKWNSEEQLLTWRVAWADAVNRCLEKWKCSERIDHRSHAERGIDEQPTIHEGVTAGKLEYKGIVSDRRELNRQIKADNELLRELKAQIKKLTNAVKEVIPAVAETLEKIREHMVTLQYHLLHNSAEIAN
ncbi:MAG: MobA/MobL family protein, partial [Lachnospiraceae bacterium]|nr:MobA/MobL family protein [Lachnospiraceae bacterium]